MSVSLLLPIIGGLGEQGSLRRLGLTLTGLPAIVTLLIGWCDFGVLLRVTSQRGHTSSQSVTG